jgi:uncharacterized LabA/DUF88 family protein
MSGFGTLFLYDSENMKVPMLQSDDYEVPRINIEELTNRLRKRFRDTHHHFISFGRRYFGENNKRNEPIDRYNKRLRSMHYSIVEKDARIKKNTVVVDGKRITYKYEDCDMDGEIIHIIHTLGKDYSRVVLISGDGDMKPSLDYIHDTFGVEIWIVSHKETVSNKYKKENNVLTIKELLAKG